MSKEPNRNVYVGHRYVPKIFGEWDNTQDYEGLSIVTYQGTSYTSKKRVPVGIDILNNEFWVATGNYNAQVDEYRAETERVSKQLDSKSDITYVDTELSKKSDITYVDTELDKKADPLYVDTEIGKKASGIITSDEFDTIHEAIASALNTNKTLVISPGTYHITSPIIIDGSIKIQGTLEGVVFDFRGMSSGTALTVGDFNAVNGFNIDGLTMKGTVNLQAIKINNRSNTGIAVTDSVFSNLRIEGFDLGLSGTYAWCNTFYNVRFQNCNTPMEVGPQFNNTEFIRTSLVSFKNRSRFSNCEGLHFASPNIGNINSENAFELFQSQVLMTNPYIEYLDDNFARVGSSNELIESSLNIISPKVTDDEVDIVISGHDARIEVTGQDKPFYIKQHLDSLIGGKSSSNIKVDNKKQYIQKNIFEYNGEKDFTFNGAYGGATVNTSFEDDGVVLSLDGTGYNGIMISQNLTIGKEYTLIYALKDTATFHNTETATLLHDSNGYIEYKIPFVAKSETARMIWNNENDLRLHKLILMEGQNFK